jgi:outer membrane protein assembly factor BamA
VIVGVLVAILATGGAIAHADDEPQPIVGFRVRGHSKVKPHTVARLCHVDIGDPITADDIPDLVQALLTSELFKSAEITLEPAPGGVLVVATLDDKQSWLVAPTLYVLPGNRAVGVGYAENDLLGEDKKLLLYGQIGDSNTFFFGTYFDPAIGRSKFSWRFDVYLLRKVVDEYDNTILRAPTVGRISTETYLDGGALVGWTPVYWLTSQLRLRGARLTFRDAHADDAAKTPLAAPERNGYDLMLENFTTIDNRHHKFGVSWGPYIQTNVSVSVPGLSDFTYANAVLKANYSWALFGDHEFEIRTSAGTGWHLPFMHELTIGGGSDQRGFRYQQFRGDVRLVGRAEYSIPIYRRGSFAFRGLGFYDTGYIAFRHTADDTGRDYLPTQLGTSSLVNSVGAGLRLYVSSIVLPLLGFDVGYGLEAHSAEVYFELGITDF